MPPNPRPAPKPATTSSGSTLAVVLATGGVLLVGCCGIGALAAIAIPNFIRFQGRSKQAECRTNLQALYAGQRAFWSETRRYERSFGAVGFPPPGSRRYTSFMGSGVELGPSAPEAKAVPASALPPLAGGQPPGVVGSRPPCSFAAVCAADLDGDQTLDVWSISSSDRLVGATTIPAGERTTT